MCREHYERVWTFRTKRFTVTLDACPEPDPDLSWDDTGEVGEKLASGEWTNFLFRFCVYFDGLEVATDYLGNSIYAEASQFRDHIGSQGRYGSYFTDGVRMVIAGAREALANVPRLRKAA